MTKEQFKQARIDLRMTQRQFAEALGKNVRTIQRMEVGDWKVYAPVAEAVQELMRNKGE